LGQFDVLVVYGVIWGTELGVPHVSAQKKGNEKRAGEGKYGKHFASSQRQSARDQGGFEIESEYRPAREVGGDFFQIIPHDRDGSLLVVPVVRPCRSDPPSGSRKVQRLHSRKSLPQHYLSALVHPYQMKRRLAQIDTQRE
jgi:hypothetical protein